MKWIYSVCRTLAVAAVIALSLTGETQKFQYSPRDKAFYADAATVQFVRPGLVLKITSAQIASDGTITAVYTLADPVGLPLDAAGITTPGGISLGYVAAVLPNNEEQYTAYTTRANSGVAVASTNQPNADSGGAVTNLAPGQYQYVFHAKAPAGFDATATHTIGIYASRTLTDFSLPTNYASATFNFVPNGSKVTKTRDVVKTASCNSCHDQLSWHGGRRRGIEMCVLCHTPQNVDTTTGGTLDLKVMVHELHMGSQLPSVVAGKPLLVNGTDFSKVVMPSDPRRCEACHSQTTGAAQATAYLLKPTRAACGACHNDANFATGVNHPGGPQFDDNLCSTCHIPQGELDFDASIKGAHTIPTESAMLTGLVVTLTKIQNGVAGAAPIVNFTLKDGSGNPLLTSKLGSISFTMAGPTADYGYTSFGSDVTTPGYVTESASAGSSCGADGTCTYTFKHAVPANATGSFAIGVEARRSETLLAGTTSQQVVQYGAKNQVLYFSVDGSPVAPRRAVVAIDNCNQCHVALSVHGGLRNQTEYCVLCHNPSNTDISVRPAATTVADRALPPQGINFNLLVHRIHFGKNLPANRPYVVVGFGGSHNDFSGTLFPAMSPTGAATDTRYCANCHVNGSEQNLPLGLNAATDPQGPINPIPAISSACSGCHVQIATASHMLANTTSLGESCTVCHAAGTVEAVGQAHAQY